ncbi:retrovirus-related pol polyprotein from transposon TNT 1-94 [Tanacetum coccineum]
MSQEIMHIVANSVDILDVKKENYGENINALTFNQLFEINELKVQSQEKDTVIRKLKERIKSLSGKDNVEIIKKDIYEIETINIELEHRTNVVNTVVSKPNATIAPGMFKINIEPISPRLKNIKDAHEVYIEKTTNTLCGFVERARTQYPSKPLLESACMFTKHVQELISRPPHSNQKNKVEDHPWKVKSSLNKRNSVYEPISNALVKHSVRNAKFESICAICNKCLFDANHGMCLIDFVNDVNVVQIVLWYLDSRCSKHMTGNHSQLMNFVSKFLGTVRFGNDQVAKIMGYGDYQQGNVIISRVYYVEGLRHNLFFVGQFCDADLEVAFRKNTCFIRNLEDISVSSSNHKLSKTKSWLWHRRLSHLNFGTLNKLAKDGLARGIPKLKFHKDRLCSACALGKSKNLLINPKLRTLTKRNYIFCIWIFVARCVWRALTGKIYLGNCSDERILSIYFA